MVGQPRDVDVELIRYRSLGKYRPRVGDFIIYTGWVFNRWYGVVSAIDNDGELTIIKDGIPSLLFTMNEANYSKNSIKISVGSLIDSSPGAYSIQQDGVWYCNG